MATSSLGAVDCRWLLGGEHSIGKRKEKEQTTIWNKEHNSVPLDHTYSNTVSIWFCANSF